MSGNFWANIFKKLKHLNLKLGSLYIKMGKLDETKEEILNAKELYKSSGKDEEVNECIELLKTLEETK
jgi:hypothetical protein